MSTAEATAELMERLPAEEQQQVYEYASALLSAHSRIQKLCLADERGLSSENAKRLRNMDEAIDVIFTELRIG